MGSLYKEVDVLEINGTLVNYYVHCKRQCYLHGNRLNLEDNSELVKTGKALHEAKDDGADTELKIENIKVDRLTKDYLIEVKKSDADLDAAKWQLLYYLYVLKSKGIERKGKLQIMERNKREKKTMIVTLDIESEERLAVMKEEIRELIGSESIPPVLKKVTCRKCAYFEYCYI